MCIRDFTFFPELLSGNVTTALQCLGLGFGAYGQQSSWHGRPLGFQERIAREQSFLLSDSAMWRF